MSYKYRFQIDGKPALLDRDGECVICNEQPIAHAERFIAYGAACLFVANSLVGLAGDVHEVGDMGDAFYERAFDDLSARWLDYVVDCHSECSGEDTPEADRVPAMSREDAEEAMEAMRMRMSNFVIVA